MSRYRFPLEWHVRLNFFLVFFYRCSFHLVPKAKLICGCSWATPTPTPSVLGVAFLWIWGLWKITYSKMVTFYVIVANPVVLLVHVVALALILPHLIPLTVLLLLFANLIVAQEPGGLGVLALCAVREASRRQAMLGLVFQVECSTVGWNSQHDFIRWTAILDPFRILFEYIFTLSKWAFWK